MKPDPELAAYLNTGDEIVTADAPGDEESNGDVPHALDKFFADAQLGAGPGFQREVAVLDSRASRIYKAIASEAAKQTPPAASFPERSKQRFEKVCGEIRTIFAGHEAEAEEAIKLAKDLLAAERAAVLAAQA